MSVLSVGSFEGVGDAHLVMIVVIVGDTDNLISQLKARRGTICRNCRVIVSISKSLTAFWIGEGDGGLSGSMVLLILV
jgi:hypothetical protein